MAIEINIVGALKSDKDGSGIFETARNGDGRDNFLRAPKRPAIAGDEWRACTRAA